MIVLGVLLLIGAGVLGVSTLANNSGDAHQLTGGVAVLGYHLNMSAGRLFGYGLALGAAAMLGLVLLFGGSARMSRSRARTRRALAEARKNEAPTAVAAPVVEQRRRRTWPGQSVAEPVVEEPVVEETSDDEPTLVEQSTPRRFGRERKPVVVETETQERPEQVPVVVGSASRTMSDDADLTETRTD